MSVISWDRQEDCDAPLTEKQLEAIFILSTLDYRDPPPIKDDDDGDHITPTQSMKLANDQNADDKVDGVHLQLASHFYSWLSSVEQNFAIAEDQEAVNFLNYLSEKRDFCTALVDDLSAVLSNLTLLNEHYTRVSAKTNSLHNMCEHLVKQQNELSSNVAKIEQVLTMFLNVDIAETELRSIQIVSKDRMKPILDRLDVSMQFFRQYMDFHESETYLSRATNTLSRALNLIHQHVTRIIDRMINELMELHDVVSPDNSFILLYGRFRSQGPKIRTLVSLIEDRVSGNNEYMQSLLQCHTFYLHRRQDLLVPVVRSGIVDLMGKYPTNHCALLRTGGAFMVHMCEDETKLFSQFFNLQYSSSFNRMLTDLCRCLYDAYRPLLIHINHVEILTELCDILKYELVEEHVSTSEIDLSAFVDICAMLLADVQERLIYRAHIHIKSQILGFEPSPGDLSYPEKLIMMNNIAKSMKSADNSPSTSIKLDSLPSPPTAGSTSDPVEETSTSAVPDTDVTVQPGPNMSLAPADLHGMWYPTVRRALVCLSKLSRSLDAESFRGLAQECVAMCVQSLLKAKAAITERCTSADGQLFLIKHLLILREQMAPFNVEFAVKETSLDFSHYKNAAVGIWTKRGSGLLALNRHNLLLRFLLETPKVVEVEIDSRRQLDGQLKETCEQFIHQTVTSLCGDLPSFLVKAEAVLAAPGARLADQEFANPSSLKEIVSEVHRNLCSALGRGGHTKPTDGGSLIRILNTYLANPDTEGILMRHIQTGVFQHWYNLHRLLREHYSDEDRIIVACPTESQIRLLFQES